MDRITNEEVRDWLLNDVFQFNSIRKGENVNLIVKSSILTMIKPNDYLKTYKSSQVSFDLSQVLFMRNSFDIKFKDYCYYYSRTKEDIDVLFVVDSDKNRLFTVDIDNELVSKIAECLNINNALNKACLKVRDDYYSIDSLVVDITNKNVFINYIDNLNPYEIKTAYNEVQLFRTFQESKSEFWNIFSELAFDNSINK